MAETHQALAVQRRFSFAVLAKLLAAPSGLSPGLSLHGLATCLVIVLLRHSKDRDIRGLACLLWSAGRSGAEAVLLRARLAASLLRHAPVAATEATLSASPPLQSFVPSLVLVLLREAFTGGLQLLWGTGPFCQVLRAQGKRIVSILKSLFQILAEPHSFLGHVATMLVPEGLTSRGVTLEQVAEECLGAGNHAALRGQVAIITLASGGLGLEQARVLLKYGCHVVLAVRNPAKTERLLEELRTKEPLSGRATVLQVDLDDLATVKPFVEKFLALGLPLHFLVNDAGVMTQKEFQASKQGHETLFARSHVAHFLLTELLLPKLRETRRLTGADARVVVLSSVGSCLGKDCDWERPRPPSRRRTHHGVLEGDGPKAVNLLRVRDLQRRCAADGISCCAGVIQTGRTREGNQDSLTLHESVLFT